MTLLGFVGVLLTCAALIAASTTVALRMRRKRGVHEALDLPDTDVDRLGLRGAVDLVGAAMGETCDAVAEKLRLERRLVEAGMPLGGITARDFVAYGVIWSSGGALVGFGSAWLVGVRWPAVVAAVVFASVLATTIWWLSVGDRVSARREQIRREFPFLLDTIVMVRSVGATLVEALVVYERASSGAILAGEIRYVLNSKDLANRPAEALRSLLARITAEEVRATLDSMAKAEELGGSMNAQLLENAAVARARRIEQIEKSTESLKAKIAIPTAFILVAVLLIVIGPAFVELGSSGLFSR